MGPRSLARCRWAQVRAMQQGNNHVLVLVFNSVHEWCAPVLRGRGGTQAPLMNMRAYIADALNDHMLLDTPFHTKRCPTTNHE